MAQAAAVPGTGSPLDDYLRVQAAAQAMPPTAGETAARGELAANKPLLGELTAIRQRPTPQLQQQPLPPRPDTSIKQASWEFLLSAVPMILMGSRKSRAPLTAALMAGGAALQGYNQGQMDSAHQKQEEWRDNLDLAIKQNQQELEAYRAAIEKNKGDMDAVIAEIHAHAAAAGDEIALQQIQDGKVKDLFHMIEHREDMTERLQEHRETIGLEYARLTEDKRYHDLTARWHEFTRTQPGKLTAEQQLRWRSLNAEMQDALRQRSALGQNGIYSGPLVDDLDKKVSDINHRMDALATDAGVSSGGTPKPAAAASPELEAGARAAFARGGDREAIKKRWLESGGSEEEFNRAFPPSTATPAGPPALGGGEAIVPSLGN